MEKIQVTCETFQKWQSHLDESFLTMRNFSFSNSNLSGNSGFYMNIYEPCPETVQYRGQDKNVPKVLVSSAIYEAEISEAFISLTLIK